MSSFAAHLIRELLFLALCVAGLWLVTRRRDAWLRFVEHDLAADRRIGLPETYISFARRFCSGRGIIVFLWIVFVLGFLFLCLTVWLHVAEKMRPNPPEPRDRVSVASYYRLARAR
jgi:hypothetical protein